jgi:hypothetical protein
MAMRREKLTVELEPELRGSLTRWALDEDRPVGNLLRRIVAEAVLRRFPTSGPPPPAPPFPVRIPPATLDEAKAKLHELTAERAGLMKRNGPPGPASNYLSIKEQNRLGWLHNEVADLKRDVRRLEQQERVA